MEGITQDERSSMHIPDWNGHQIEVAKSRGGVPAVCRHFTNLVQGDVGVGESTEIAQKLYHSEHERDFDPGDQERLKACLGYYTDLQSLHSEDAITWSVFGTVAKSDEAVRTRWTGEFFGEVGLGSSEPAHSEITLWRRIPHPQTNSPDGPEIDFSISTEDTLLLGECKWTGKVAGGQGVHRDLDQIEMRLMHLELYGRTMTVLDKDTGLPVFKRLAVLLVSIDPVPVSPKWIREGITTLSTTWDRVCALQSHPFSEELGRYYRWKLSHTRRKDGRKEDGPSWG